MPTSTTNIYEISLRLVENTPLAVITSPDGKRQEKSPVLMRGVPSILRIRLFRVGGLVKAAELSALYTGFRLVIANDFDDTTAPLLVSDENGATIDSQNDCIVLPMTSMNTETLEALIGTKDRLDLGAELQLFKPPIQDEPIEAWQFPVGVQNRRDLTGTATPAPGSVNYYTKDEADTLLDGKIGTSEKGVADGVAELDSNGKVPSDALPIATIGEPAATAGKLGCVYLGGNMGFKMTIVNDTPILTLDKPNAGEIANRTSPYKAITVKELNAVVTAALTDANHITLTAAQQQTARGVLGIDGTTDIIALTGASGTVEPGKCYSLTMTEDFTLSASSVASGIYGESVLFVVPNTHAFSVASGITLDAEMVAGLRYRLLVSWTPFGVHAEQTAEWEA